MIRCEVICAWPGRSWSVHLQLPEGATVADALAQAQQLSPEAIDWNGAVGVHGEACSGERRLEPGDRVEIYRPLAVDPKESRRRRAAAAAGSARRSLRR